MSMIQNLTNNSQIFINDTVNLTDAGTQNFDSNNIFDTDNNFEINKNADFNNFNLNFDSNLHITHYNETVKIWGWDTGFCWVCMPWYKKGPLVVVTIFFWPLISTGLLWVLACAGAIIAFIFKCIESVVLMSVGTEAIQSEFGMVDCDLDTPSGGTTSDSSSDSRSVEDVGYYSRNREYYV